MAERAQKSEASRRSLAMWLLLVTAAVVAVLGASAAARFWQKGAVGDYRHYYYAAKGVVEGQNLYTQHDQQYGYLPIWALVQTVFVPLGVGGAGAAWTVCNTLFILAALWFGADEVLRRLGARAGPLVRALVVAIPALVLSDKIRAELRMGQSDGVILLCFVLALRWLGTRPVLAGVLLGFVANFKLQSLVMLPYFVVRRRWAALASTVASSVGFAVVGSLVWGWDRNNEYLGIVFGSLLKMVGAKQEVANGIALYPLAWELSVSAPSVLARLAEAIGRPEGKVAVAGTGLLAACAFAAGWWMYARNRVNLFVGRGRSEDDQSARGRLLVLLEWTGLMMGELAFSPQTPVRHLFLLLFLAQIAVGLAVVSARHRWLLGVLVVFWMGLVLPPSSMEAAERGWRSVGGQMAVSLVLYFCTLWCGLDRAADLREERGPV